MKKRLSAIVAALVALAMCFGMITACAPPDEPTPEPTTYTVTFDANGGVLDGNAKVEVEEGKTITGAPTASKENAEFDGWFTAATGGTEINLSTYTVTADVTLYAQYTEEEEPGPGPGPVDPDDPDAITITFDPNGGVLEGDATVTTKKGEPVPTMPRAAMEGYYFHGWFHEKEGGKRVNMVYATFEEDTTVYAQWVKQPELYAITFDATTNGGKLEGGMSVYDIYEGESLTEIPSASKDNAEFLGWFDAATGGTEINFDTYLVEADDTIYAQFRDREARALVMEAEDAEYTGGKVSTAANASGGEYLGSMSRGNTVTFTFTSTANGTAEIVFYMSSANTSLNWSTWQSQYNDQNVSASVLSVTLNGEPVTFETQTLRGSGTGTANVYWDVISLGIDCGIQEGTNTIVVTANGSSGGMWGNNSNAMPAFDRMEVLSDALAEANALDAAEGGETPGPGGDDEPVDPSDFALKIEAENQDNVVIEGTPNYNQTFYETNVATASGNASLGSLNTAGNTITITFYSAKAGTAEIIFYMSSTALDFNNGGVVGDMTVTPEMFSVTLNGGAVIDFEDQVIRGSGQAGVYNTYWDPVSMGEQNIIAGENEIVITVLDGGSMAQMPNFDYIGIKSDALKGSLSLTPVAGPALIIEAENQEAVKVEGELSSNDGSITSFVESNVATASGNASLGYLGVVGNTVTFTFESTKAGKGEIIFYMTSNNTQMDFSTGTFNMWVDDQTVTNEIFSVTLNGNNIAFQPATLRGAGQEMPMTWNYYWDPVTMGEQDIIAGTNTVVITVLQTSIPNIDYMEIKSEELAGALSAAGATAPDPEAPAAEEYTKDVNFDIIVIGEAGGPAISKVVLEFEDEIAATALKDNLFAAYNGNKKLGTSQEIYLSDANGNAVDTATAKYVTIEYEIAYSGWSFTGNLSPFTYTQHNVWNDITAYTVKLSGDLVIGEKTYDELTSVKAPADWTIPDMADWKTDGKGKVAVENEQGEDVYLTYGYYETAALKADGVKNPLIVWLHGAGEGGTDPDINILGNQVTNLSKDIIQKYFKTETSAGAYVLAPQTPTFWMDNIYNDALFSLIQDYVKENGDIDESRIYVGGCSNGGWMTVKIVAAHPDYFAAAFPICEAVPATEITEEMINAMKDVPIWFTHSANDNTVRIADVQYDWMTGTSTVGDLQDAYTNNLYIRLINAGATDVHYSLFETVNVEGVNYDGHWSWIYTLRDECKYVQPTEGEGETLAISDLDPKSTTTLKLDGQDVTLWGWLAAQVNTPAATTPEA